MKKIAYIILTITIIIGCNSASDKIKETPQKSNKEIISEVKDNNVINAQIIDNGGAAAFNWTNEGGKVWNFGSIKEGDSPEFTFTFENSGTEPMIISNAKGSCGCTVPQWPKEPIAPGEKGEISVKFNSKNKKGSQNKTVTITANTTPPTTKLRVTGQIETIE
ncbi:MAG: hypothetical protein CMP65_00325 [Flavobacteriales bacterium]|nr:hypothetical protein [Flavobacteriales bacterium]|tara:strand:+ start:24515 stop:25003 length:489 start_codon:yes stop_codon:yes gene_type:complete